MIIYNYPYDTIAWLQKQNHMTKEIEHLHPLSSHCTSDSCLTSHNHLHTARAILQPTIIEPCPSNLRHNSTGHVPVPVLLSHSCSCSPLPYSCQWIFLHPFLSLTCWWRINKSVIQCLIAAARYHLLPAKISIPLQWNHLKHSLTTIYCPHICTWLLGPISQAVPNRATYPNFAATNLVCCEWLC